jgi:hypothetical protein
MSLTEDKERVLKVLTERKGTTLNRLRVVDILNKNAKADVDAALGSLVTDSVVKSEDPQNIFFSAATTTTTV